MQVPRCGCVSCALVKSVTGVMRHPFARCTCGEEFSVKRSLFLPPSDVACCLQSRKQMRTLVPNSLLGCVSSGSHFLHTSATSWRSPGAERRPGPRPVHSGCVAEARLSCPRPGGEFLSSGQSRGRRWSSAGGPRSHARSIGHNGPGRVGSGMTCRKAWSGHRHGRAGLPFLRCSAPLRSWGSRAPKSPGALGCCWPGAGPEEECQRGQGGGLGSSVGTQPLGSSLSCGRSPAHGLGPPSATRLSGQW
ncbi:uncharacterized protein LOC115304209 [Suricata suricatta]|uniref:uncharacterized protein LOC115304209 n=1 Tax=Suricata suricatta TaxID=37032 RepID=UPI001155A4E8|nr:uncharacterized protein LOC115304209 [Suricata suricatta]